MNELFFVVSLITMIQGGKPVGTATGFFHTRNNALYFVTNRHVVVEEAKGLKADILRVRLHTDPNDLTKNVDRDITLYKDGKATWHVHKDYAKRAMDIAVIEVDANSLTNGAYIKALSASNFLPEEFLINPGEDVMVIGFPRGLSDSTHNFTASA